MREMKDSGIEWIGKIPKEWEIVQVKRLFHVQAGGDAKPRYYSYEKDETHKYPVYTNSANRDQIYAYTSKPIYDKGTITVAGRGTLGISFLRNTPYDAIIRLLSVSPISKKNIIPKFWEYWFNATNISLDDQTTIGQLSAKQFEIKPAIIISMLEQQAIANFLDSKCWDIDTLSADIEKQIETLKEYKKSLITRAVTKGLDPNIEMKDTTSPYWNRIPANWSLSDIKYLFEIVKRIAGKEGYDILSVTQKGLKIKDISKNEGQIAENYSNYQFVYPGDFVMNHMDLLTGWVDLSRLFGVTSPDYRVFRLRNAKKNYSSYYRYVMQCCYSCRIFYSLGQGVSNLGRWRLQTFSFNNFQVPVPPLQEQQAIADFLDSKCAEIDAVISGKEKQLETLKEYKKSLIYTYVTGKKEVPCFE